MENPMLIFMVPMATPLVKMPKFENFKASGIFAGGIDKMGFPYPFAAAAQFIPVVAMVAIWPSS